MEESNIEASIIDREDREPKRATPKTNRLLPDQAALFTSIEEPFMLFNPIDESFKWKINDDMESNDILYTSVDHLPAEMPKEASNHFGSKLMPFVEAVVKSDFTKPFAE